MTRYDIRSYAKLLRKLSIKPMLVDLSTWCEVDVLVTCTKQTNFSSHKKCENISFSIVQQHKKVKFLKANRGGGNVFVNSRQPVEDLFSLTKSVILGRGSRFLYVSGILWQLHLCNDSLSLSGIHSSTDISNRNEDYFCLVSLRRIIVYK